MYVILPALIVASGRAVEEKSLACGKLEEGKDPHTQPPWGPELTNYFDEAPAP